MVNFFYVSIQILLNLFSLFFFSFTKKMEKYEAPQARIVHVCMEKKQGLFLLNKIKITNTKIFRKLKKKGKTASLECVLSPGAAIYFWEIFFLRIHVEFFVNIYIGRTIEVILY
jgi:hypothetical protein